MVAVTDKMLAELRKKVQLMNNDILVIKQGIMG